MFESEQYLVDTTPIILRKYYSATIEIIQYQ